MVKKGMKSITSGDIWDSAYSLDNYYIYDTEKEGNLCVIYFSSSSIYYPNTNEAMQERIIEQDYYEWKNYLIQEASRHIFIRDVAKQFYVYGISKTYPTIDDVIELLKEITEGYDIITVGSSAGGYMAALVGALLNAKRVYCFSAFFSLSNINQEVWYLIDKEKNNPLFNKYFEIRKFVEEAKNTNFYYVLPGLSKDEINNDSVQCKYVEDLENVYIIRMKEKKHGVCMFPYVLEEYLNVNPERIKVISQREKWKLVSKWKFSIYILGVKKSVFCYVKHFLNRCLCFYRDRV